MLEDWQDVFGCPHCRSGLVSADGEGGALRCSGCGERFAVEGRIPVLVRREDAAGLARFAQQYQEARLREGWQRLTPEQARRLSSNCAGFLGSLGRNRRHMDVRMIT